MLLALTNLAEVDLATGALDAAAGRFERALAARERLLGRDHAQLIAPLLGLAEVERKRGRFDAARPLAERALAIAERDDATATDRARARFVLARALATTDRPRAVELARHSREALAAAGPLEVGALATVDAWLADAAPAR